MPEGITSIMPTFLSLIIAFVIIYFLMIKPQKKRKRNSSYKRWSKSWR